MPRLSVSLATMLCGVLAASRTARADDPPCAAEARVVQAMKQRDPSLAEPGETVRDLMEAAKRAYGVQDYAAAIKDYTDAGKLDPSPRILYDLAQTYRSSKDYSKAIPEYELFRQRGQPGPEVDALVECWVSTMKMELEHAASTAPPTGPAGDAATTAPARIDRRATPHLSRWTGERKVAAGIALVGVGALVAGTVFEIQTGDLRNQADELCPTSPCSQADQANALTDRANSRSTLGGVSLGVGGALVAGAVVLWFIGGPSSGNSGDAALVPQIGPSFAGMAYVGSF